MPYRSEVLFSLDDFMPGQIVTLTINQNKYLLLTNNILVNVQTGQVSRDIKVMFGAIKAVYANNMKQLAIRQENKLYQYEPFKHDAELARIKRMNKLLTAHELENKLRDDKLFLTTANLLYRKRAPVKLFVNSVATSFRATYAQQVLQKRVYITKQRTNDQVPNYIDSQIVSLNCLVDRIEIDKKQELYLYQYQLAPYIF